ncbi:hypothetical protein [Cupriavidus sp. OTU4895]|uniref:hypothetical protein n=1 Tax=Cupriavidus sp. OTU4895 TaxID=3043852 RepID=UPI00313D8508
MWQRQSSVFQPAREESAGTRVSGVSRGISDVSNVSASHPAWLDALQDVAVFDLAPDGHIRQWTHAAWRTFRYAEEEVVGRHVSWRRGGGGRAGGGGGGGAAPPPGADTHDDTVSAGCDRRLDSARDEGRGEWRGWCA